MRAQIVAEIVASARKLANETQRLVEFFQRYVDAENRPFDTTQEIPQTDSSTADVINRIFIITAFIEKFEGTSPELAPINVLKQLLAASEDVAAQEGHLINHLATEASNKGGLRRFNYSSFDAAMKNDSGIQVLSVFTSYFNSVEALLSAFSINLNVLKPSKGALNFQVATRSLSTMLEGIREDQDKLRDRIVETDKAFEQVVTVEAEARTSFDEVKRIQKETGSDRQTVSEYLAEITQKKADFDSIISKTTTLEAEVNEYQDKFLSFERQLHDRELRITAGTAVLDALTSSLDEQDRKITDAIARAEQMLASSTTAGLASHFHKIHSDLTKEMNAARRSFNLGIWALFFSAIPLIFLIFSPILFPLLGAIRPDWAATLKTFVPDKALDGWQYTGQVISRLIVLVPAAWFVRFSSIRYASLFRLREHYAYKYSMAVSVDGFKKQAVGYQDEIAAMVLEQLAFNPADKLIPSKDMAEGKVPHPLLNFMMAKMEKRLKALNAE